MNKLEKYTTQINQLCKIYQVKSLNAFGSVLTENFHNQSDLDLIVDFSNMPVDDYADNYFEFKFALQDIFKRPIDLLEEKAIKNPYSKQSVNSQRQLVYG